MTTGQDKVAVLLWLAQLEYLTRLQVSFTSELTPLRSSVDVVRKLQMFGASRTPNEGEVLIRHAFVRNQHKSGCKANSSTFTCVQPHLTRLMNAQTGATERHFDGTYWIK